MENRESRLLLVRLFFSVTYLMQGFPGGSVVKKPPAQAGDIMLKTLDPERSHMPWSS